ncbi:MAG: DMT family transporter [Deltaproteobacteria bacterium]|nr:MAG: DMT family transporter [Deltaproteobacteria bacterium]
MIRILLNSGLLLMTFSAFFYALGDICIKFISPSIGSVPIAFFRFVLGGLILLPLLARGQESLRGSSTRYLLLRGFTGTLAFFCLVKSIAMIPLSNAMVLFYTFPLFAALFSFFILKESLARMEVTLIGVGLIGVFVLINPSSHSLGMGHVYGLLAGAFAGLTVVIIRRVRRTNGPLLIYFYFCVVGGAVSFPLFIANFTLPSFELFALLIALAVLLLIAQLLMNQGFKFCKASEGSVILMSEVVFTGVAGVLLFHDSPGLSFFIGACLIVGSGVGLNLINRTPFPVRSSRNT